ncbi:hypothetical protein CHLRE_10g419350v5 [Chlamydomonas reinhardtii]|uniref:Uncharacterized protein n=1 Tax=Chlamydomonas reinhardtii TaxID=3055 RepID=A0A2K3D920_CHLRE|nr:uncharacterized protein CHLRE_10g419350v5 [Chlamydomonas reinhardtii]PNW77029.1 hypothetical protein CHLRE_10g419350v5 [Chlamydomonas reinhardtii]
MGQGGGADTAGTSPPRSAGQASGDALPNGLHGTAGSGDVGSPVRPAEQQAEHELPGQRVTRSASAPDVKLAGGGSAPASKAGLASKFVGLIDRVLGGWLLSAGVSSAVALAGTQLPKSAAQTPCAAPSAGGPAAARRASAPPAPTGALEVAADARLTSGGTAPPPAQPPAPRPEGQSPERGHRAPPPPRPPSGHPPHQHLYVQAELRFNCEYTAPEDEPGMVPRLARRYWVALMPAAAAAAVGGGLPPNTSLRVLSSPEDVRSFLEEAEVAAALSSTAKELLNNLTFDTDSLGQVADDPDSAVLVEALRMVAVWVQEPLAVLRIKRPRGVDPGWNCVTMVAREEGSPLRQRLLPWSFAVLSSSQVRHLRGLPPRPALCWLDGGAQGKRLRSVWELLHAPPNSSSVAQRLLCHPAPSADRSFRFDPRDVLAVQRLVAMLHRRQVGTRDMRTALEELLDGDPLYGPSRPGRAAAGGAAAGGGGGGSAAGYSGGTGSGSKAGVGGSGAGGGGSAAGAPDHVAEFLHDLGITQDTLSELVHKLTVARHGNIDWCAACGPAPRYRKIAKMKWCRLAKLTDGRSCDDCVDSFCATCIKREGHREPRPGKRWTCKYCELTWPPKTIKDASHAAEEQEPGEGEQQEGEEQQSPVQAEQGLVAQEQNEGQETGLQEGEGPGEEEIQEQREGGEQEEHDDGEDKEAAGANTDEREGEEAEEASPPPPRKRGRPRGAKTRPEHVLLAAAAGGVAGTEIMLSRMATVRANGRLAAPLMLLPGPVQQQPLQLQPYGAAGAGPGGGALATVCTIATAGDRGRGRGRGRVGGGVGGGQGQLADRAGADAGAEPSGTAAGRAAVHAPALPAPVHWGAGGAAPAAAAAASDSDSDAEMELAAQDLDPLALAAVREAGEHNARITEDARRRRREVAAATAAAAAAAARAVDIAGEGEDEETSVDLVPVGVQRGTAGGGAVAAATAHPAAAAAVARRGAQKRKADAEVAPPEPKRRPPAAPSRVQAGQGAGGGAAGAAAAALGGGGGAGAGHAARPPATNRRQSGASNSTDGSEVSQSQKEEAQEPALSPRHTRGILPRAPRAQAGRPPVPLAPAAASGGAAAVGSRPKRKAAALAQERVARALGPQPMFAPDDEPPKKRRRGPGPLQKPAVEVISLCDEEDEEEEEEEEEEMEEETNRVVLRGSGRGGGGRAAVAAAAAAPAPGPRAGPAGGQGHVAAADVGRGGGAGRGGRGGGAAAGAVGAGPGRGATAPLRPAAVGGAVAAVGTKGGRAGLQPLRPHGAANAAAPQPSSNTLAVAGAIDLLSLRHMRVPSQEAHRPQPGAPARAAGAGTAPVAAIALAAAPAGPLLPGLAAAGVAAGMLVPGAAGRDTTLAAAGAGGAAGTVVTGGGCCTLRDLDAAFDVIWEGVKLLEAQPGQLVTREQAFAFYRFVSNDVFGAVYNGPPPSAELVHTFEATLNAFEWLKAPPPGFGDFCVGPEDLAGYRQSLQSAVDKAQAAAAAEAAAVVVAQRKA